MAKGYKWTAALPLWFSLFLVMLFPLAATTSPSPLQQSCLSSATFTSVSGHGGAPLNVMETGNPNGPHILFIHGMHMNHLCFMPQYSVTNDDENIDLTKHFRIVSFDLRGHGNSAKPWRRKEIAPSKVWADDIAAIIQAKKLHKPIVVAWSFGGYVIADYVRKYGTSKLGAINFVGTTGGFIEYAFPLQTGDESMEDVKAKVKAKAEKAASGNLLAALTATDENIQRMEFPSMTSAYRESLRMASVMTPPYFKKILSFYSLDHQDVISKLREIPILVSLGEKDPFVNSVCYKRLQMALPWAEFSKYPDCGHFPFVEDPCRFNTELSNFIQNDGDPCH